MLGSNLELILFPIGTVRSGQTSGKDKETKRGGKPIAFVFTNQSSSTRKSKYILFSSSIFLRIRYDSEKDFYIHTQISQ